MSTLSVDLSDVLCQPSAEKSTPVVETASSSQPGDRKLDSAAAESTSTTIMLASGSPLRSTTDIVPHRDDSLTRWNVQSGRRAPVGGLALTPPPRSPERPVFNATVSKVDRGCSPFRFSELSALGLRTQAEVTADTVRSLRTLPASGPRQRCSFATSTATGSKLKTHEDRCVVLGRLRARPSPNTNCNCRSAVDYRRQARERQRHLQVLESNRTLEKFMSLLRTEKEAKATAALFSLPSTSVNCRQRSKTVSFTVDDKYRPVTSSAMTSLRDGTGNPCFNPTRWMARRSSPTDAFHLGLGALRQPLGKLKGSNRRDLDDWTKCLKDHPGRSSTPRPVS